jgi:hypothetical protein
MRVSPPIVCIAACRLRRCFSCHCGGESVAELCVEELCVAEL